MKKFEAWIAKLNNQQKIIMAIAFPVIFGILFTYIAGHWADFTDSQPDWDDWNDPLDFEDTWIVWLIYSAFILFLEFKLFENKK